MLTNRRIVILSTIIRSNYFILYLFSFVYKFLHLFPASDQMQAIQNGIDDLARASCVKFTPYKKGDRDAVVIQVSNYFFSIYQVRLRELSVETLHFETLRVE